MFRTDKQGTVILHSDGKTISWEQEPCNDYTPGTRTASGDKEEPYVEENNSDAENCDYVLNTHTKKIHLPSCSSLKGMKEENKAYYKGSKDELTDNGYEEMCIRDSRHTGHPRSTVQNQWTFPAGLQMSLHYLTQHLPR